MVKRNAILLGTALAAMLAVPALAQETASDAQETPEVAKIDATGSTVLATVNGDDITLGHLIVARQALPQQYQTLPNEVLLQGLLEQVIQQTVLGQAMGELSRRAELELENQRRAMVAEEKIDAVIATAVTEEALQAAYDEVFANAEPSPEYNASHILVETEEAAKELLTKLEAGTDFAELAKEFSTGPSGPNGGELGWFGLGMMVKPFEEAVVALEPGQVSAPVETQFGWHVVKLNDSRVKGAPTLDEVREELTAKIENDAVEQAVQGLLEAATIKRIDLETVDPETLGNLSLLGK
ncbi:peptidyl-prolyl cis-trans isomerase C [Aliiroseovarius crassostreae]|uniref:Parvulin-like PPIase n=1 Tax=Aliiroseovarius crassostreae TaxID=154981 RepID=A0A0P7JTJ8_9RHOB|nr:peptidylprolyl isomerase [Aliiroseovarius crassostreae]KPN64709.1 peptidylprolyl isomerase [Aliiroseovarius crassostreae]SFU76977.1 peptidyl-prolyl cis-trans isomerase C [Aliiroseovarius crassostreae]